MLENFNRGFQQSFGPTVAYLKTVQAKFDLWQFELCIHKYKYFIPVFYYELARKFKKAYGNFLHSCDYNLSAENQY